MQCTRTLAPSSYPLSLPCLTLSSCLPMLRALATGESFTPIRCSQATMSGQRPALMLPSLLLPVLGSAPHSVRTLLASNVRVKLPLSLSVTIYFHHTSIFRLQSPLIGV